MILDDTNKYEVYMIYKIIYIYIHMYVYMKMNEYYTIDCSLCWYNAI